MSEPATPVTQSNTGSPSAASAMDVDQPRDNSVQTVRPQGSTAPIGNGILQGPGATNGASSLNANGKRPLEDAVTPSGASRPQVQAGSSNPPARPLIPGPAGMATVNNIASSSSTSNSNPTPTNARQQPRPTNTAPAASSTKAPLTEEEKRAKLEVQMKKREALTAKKDKTMGEFLVMLEDYEPLIPEEVTDYYLQKSGFETDDPRIKRLVSLAAQKFISDIATDAFHYARVRANSGDTIGGGGAGGAGGASGTAGEGKKKAGADAAKDKERQRTTLTMSDLELALAERGINAKRPEYYF